MANTAPHRERDRGDEASALLSVADRHAEQISQTIRKWRAGKLSDDERDERFLQLLQSTVRTCLRDCPGIVRELANEVDSQSDRALELSGAPVEDVGDEEEEAL